MTDGGGGETLALWIVRILAAIGAGTLLAGILISIG